MNTNNLMAFYEAGKTHLFSIAVLRDGAYRTQYDNETLDDLRAQGRTEMELIPFDEACNRIDAAQMAEYCRAPVEITREQFHEMLEILPPCKWTRAKSCEAFYVSEALAGDIHAWYVRIGDRYWTLNRSRSCPVDLILSVVAKAVVVQS